MGSLLELATTSWSCGMWGGWLAGHHAAREGGGVLELVALSALLERRLLPAGGGRDKEMKEKVTRFA